MPRHGLTKAEKQKILTQALREQERRRAANRKAREIRNAEGRRRIEKTVPSHLVSEIRRLVAVALVELSAGREPRLRRIQTGQARAELLEGRASADEVGPPPEPVAPPPSPGVRGLGLDARRRAQAARRRARQRASGLARTTFDVPAALVSRISALVDGLVIWMSDGFDVVLDRDEAPCEAPCGSPPARPSAPQGSTVARIFDEGFPVGIDMHQDSSPLFDDIKAMLRLEHRASRAGPADD